MNILLRDILKHEKAKDGPAACYAVSSRHVLFRLFSFPFHSHSLSMLLFSFFPLPPSPPFFPIQERELNVLLRDILKHVKSKDGPAASSSRYAVLHLQPQLAEIISKVFAHKGDDFAAVLALVRQKQRERAWKRSGRKSKGAECEERQ